MELLKKLIEIQGASGDEARIKDFVLNYIIENQHNWKFQPKIVHGKGFQDTLILVFGKPRTAIYAHLDTIGFTTGYDKELIKIGGPRVEEGYELVGEDSKGKIEAELMVIESNEGRTSLKYIFDREIDRGTNLTFKPNFKETSEYIQSPYLDNRLGVWSALKVCETLENGAVVFQHTRNTEEIRLVFVQNIFWKIMTFIKL
jgi:putative aminopeptidase FrvX